MVSLKASRVIGYSYAGICLVCSLLLIINSGHMVKVNDRLSGRSTVSVTCVLTLVFSLISMVFNILLVFGLFMHRANFVKYYLRFVTTVYAFVSIGLFIGCIVVGIVISDDVRTSYVEDLSISLVGATVGFCILITLETLWYILVVWILKRVIEVIRHDAAQIAAGDDGVIIPDLI
ncbi:uncharacterized protein LOC120425429 [Culex pipiens pallens]|uniref:uncharacterized protein LOC120425429 n=1 Tax=Culex pipiens pallens TaxID=42434 RepID=UPI001953A8CE|nr:uncharacterized protein LOC120425429 [Culex pipiens pallens]